MSPDCSLLVSLLGFQFKKGGREREILMAEGNIVAEVCILISITIFYG